MTPLETQLYEALVAATGWNWLDEDMPQEVVDQVDAAAEAFRAQRDRENIFVNY
jgi:hypothetical protein